MQHYFKLRMQYELKYNGAPFPENLSSYQKFKTFDDNWKRTPGDDNAYYLALVFNIDAYAPLKEIDRTPSADTEETFDSLITKIGY